MSDFNAHGLIFQPDKALPWMQSHAQLPLADRLEKDIYRVYFASRDPFNHSHIGYFEVDLKHPGSILCYTKEPVLSPGDIGQFDEHGVYPSSIVTVGKKKYLYYIGWNRGSEKPLFYASIGLAISDDGGRSFKKYSQAPIMARSVYDPCLVTSPSVFDGDSATFKMLYVSGLGWERDPEKGLWSTYHIKYATSDDGIHWKRSGDIAIDFADEDETNIARAAVLKREGMYTAYFSSCGRNTPYRLGCAQSLDGMRWQRKPVSSQEIVCYPYPVYYGNKTFLFYNGKNYGADGVMLASLTGET